MRRSPGRFQGGRFKVKAELHIDDMHCDACAALIKDTLEETAGVQSADVNFDGKTAVVNFDQNVVQQKTLVKKIQDLGYSATEGDQQRGATNNG
jgi:copper chaperone CopZ